MDNNDLFSLNNITATVAQLSPRRKGSNFRPLTSVSPSKINVANNTSTNYALKRVERSHSFRDQTPSSIHLSEFEQPPRSTSTPFQGTYLESGRFEKRPHHYELPTFRFEPSDISSSFLHDTNESVVSSITGLGASMESPLAHKSKIDDIKDEISHIVDQMRNSVSLGKDSSIGSGEDQKMDNDDDDDQYEDAHIDISAISMVDINELRTSTPQKSILKTKNNKRSENSMQKKVRISEQVELIDSFCCTTSSLTNEKPLQFRKRPSSSSLSSSSKGNTPKKLKLTHRVDPEISYADLRALCGDDKDPLDIINMFS